MHDTTIRETTRAHGIVKSIQRSRVTFDMYYKRLARILSLSNYSCPV